jgi:alpha-tubulin suppressor-like RCC1 family protein
VAISAGDHHSLALTQDGTIVGWGWGYIRGGLEPPQGSNFVAISAGSHSLALTDDERVVGWGDGTLGQTEEQNLNF